ncbi:MAG: hypothetical protein J5871_02460 [Bacteroidales bacterium]|nr:hypothetical protein [Bacteroidales bacterium]
MKKIPFILILSMLAVSCQQKPVEMTLAKKQVELTGNGYQAFSLGADVKLMMVENPETDGKWAICASVPLRKESAQAVSVPVIELNLLDDNGMKVRDNFVLAAEDLDNVIPLYNAARDVERMVIFSAAGDSRKDFSYKEAAAILAQTASMTMTVNFGKAAAQTAAVTAEDGQPTLASLLEKHSIHWRLGQYDKALKNGEKKKAKQIEDDLYKICKQVEKDASVPSSLSKRFRDYIEDKEDAIEDKY